MALSFDANFSIEHVYGHHRYVATSQDPATAPRGRNVYHHIISSSIGGYRSSWRIETQRLERKSQSIISWHNQCLRGYAMSIVWMILAYAIAGVAGVVFFIGVGIVGKSMLEIVNYMEHYIVICFVMLMTMVVPVGALDVYLHWSGPFSIVDFNPRL